MKEPLSILSNLNFPSDFEAVTYEEWQMQEAKRKPFNFVNRLKKCKSGKTKSAGNLKSKFSRIQN